MATTANFLDMRDSAIRVGRSALLRMIVRSSEGRPERPEPKIGTVVGMLRILGMT